MALGWSHRRRALAAVAFGVALTLVCVPRRAPATVQEQRKRLPPAVECGNPIEGVWLSHAYNESKGRWERATMTLRRVAPGSPELRSTYQNELWNGTRAEVDPPPCRPKLYFFVGQSSGEGRYAPPILTVRGTKLGPNEARCGGRLDRALGVLEGTVDPSINEFQSTMTSRFGVSPIVWRRIRCLEAPAADVLPSATEPGPAEPPPPPPITPAAKPPERGCGCGPLGAR